MAVYNIGDKAESTSYPTPNAGRIGPANDSLAVDTHNWNVANFDDNPPVLNDTPATKKSYSWNRGNGNGNGPR